ncbi:MAG: tetratricopeptide repeat protein [Nitrospiraceae bacterium]
MTSALCAVCTDLPPAFVQHDSIPPDYPQSLERELRSTLSALSKDSSNVTLLTQLAEIYLNLADDLLTDEEKRRNAYAEGAMAAKRAFELNDANADAHFLYAANLGSAARLNGLTSAALIVKEIKAHVARAIELLPSHAPALQMMGGLLAELPWFLGGDTTAAEEYLRRALASDSYYTNAHLLLAKLLIKQDRIGEARQHLLAIIHADHPHYPYTWARTFKPEAERLLAGLQSRDSRNTNP